MRGLGAKTVRGVVVGLVVLAVATVGLPLVGAPAVGAVVDGSEPVTTVAGGNGAGSALTELNRPLAVSVTPDGLIYIADTVNRRVMATNGLGANIEQVSNLDSAEGVAVGPDGSLYVAERNRHRVLRITPGPGTTVTTVAGDGGQGSGANQLDNPIGIAVSPEGDLYVVDQLNHRVQKITPEGDVTTAAGGNGVGSAANQLFSPHSVAIGPDGSLYITDQVNERVQRVAPGGTVTTVAGGNGRGVAPNQFHTPTGVAVDAAGNVYVADRENHRVQRITPAGVATTIIGGNGAGGGANQLDSPAGLALDVDGSLYVADDNNHQVLKLTAFDTTPPTVSVEATSVLIDSTTEVEGARFGVSTATFGPDGSVYVAQSDEHRVLKIAPNGTVSVVAGGNGSGSAANQLASPRYAEMGADGRLYVSDSGNGRIQRISPSGAVSTLVDGLSDNRAIALGLGGTVFVAENGKDRIVSVAPNGSVSAQLGAGAPAGRDVDLLSVVGVAVGPDGSVFASSYGGATVYRMSPDGTVSVAAGGNGSGSGANQLNFPTGVSVGPDGSLYVADSGNDRVQRIDPQGAASTVAGGNGPGNALDQLFQPFGVDVAPDGRLVVADNTNERVVMVAPDETLAPLGSRTAFVVSPGQTVVAGFLCADTGSTELVSCVGTLDGSPIESGRAIDTSAAGPQALQVVATDGAGNRTVERVAIVVTRGPAEDQVLRLYQAVFGRAPDAGGFAFWTGEYRGGRSLRSIVDAFIASPEFLARYGASPSNEELVDAMYRNVLGRAGDAGGVAFWLDQLSIGLSVNQLLQSFADSPENIDGTGTSEPLSSVESQVLRLYRAVFGRAPDDGGFRFWVDQAAGGRSLASIAAAFAESPEFSSRYGASPSDEALIDALYRNVLGRAGDDGGVRFWLDQRRDGLSVAELLVAFANSAENVERTGTRS